ncbi:hypothetical protein [Acidihalobacter prosperus]|nr:hypothetical protein [Acidihalobacter prosperus]
MSTAQPTSDQGAEAPSTLPVSRETLSMSVDAWLKVETNPRQRETERHALSALRAHLGQPSPVHARVSAAQLPDGRMIKLDGHSRAYLWERGLLEAPERVSVDVYRVPSIDVAKNLYTHFDNPRQMETGRDQIYGARREHDVPAESACIRYLYVSSLRMADGFVLRRLNGSYHKAEVYDIMARWKPIVEVVDAVRYPCTNAAMQTALFLTWLVYGGTRVQHQMADFWAQFYRGDKSSDAGQWLPSEALRFRIAQEKHMGGGGKTNERWLAYALDALARHLAGKTYRGKTEPVGLALPAGLSPFNACMSWLNGADVLLPEHWDDLKRRVFEAGVPVFE